MTLLNRLLATGLMTALLFIWPVAARAEPGPKAVPDYTVFLDPPTGFVFVKLPAGWKFVGQVDPMDVAKLPAQVVTRLVDRDDDESLANRPVARTTR